MNKLDTRELSRDSLFLMAEIRAEGEDAFHRVKVRNLSSGGMMAQGDLSLARGTVVHVKLRNVGEIDGTVAWAQDNRFGIAFVEEIDHRAVRGHVEIKDMDTPRFTRPPLLREEDRPRGQFRKI